MQYGTITFQGKEYPTRLVDIPGYMDAALISIDELNDLMHDADGNYISKEAEALEAIDNGIFFYVSREELQLPDKELAGTVIKHLGGEKQVEKQADRNCLYARLSQVTQEIIDAICGIKTVPDGLLPHTVFVEEVNEKGAPYYRRYQMVDIDRVDGNCIIYDNDTDYQEEISLQAINVDWLITFWSRYLEVSADVETEQTPGNTNPLEYALRLLLDVAQLEISCFEQSQTFTICNDALNGINRDNTENKELAVFLYPKERFNRNATDEEIIAGYEIDEGQDPCVEKYTPDEFAARSNDGDFNNQNYYMRFIYY